MFFLSCCRYSNGVTHQTVNNDLEGVNAILDWLSFVPRVSGADLPETPTADVIDRDVMFVPDKTSDPRSLINGFGVPVLPVEGAATPAPAPPGPDSWVSGMCDASCFTQFRCIVRGFSFCLLD